MAALTTRRFTSAQFWSAVERTAAAPAFRVTPVGRSMQGRPIRAITFGTGPTTVFLWSQMHGDESTATMALADLLQWLARTEPDSLRDELRSRLTIVMVPMLNPDGAEVFQRENAAGIDINRDARRLVTPEGRVLKAMHDSLKPAFGFNLHDQNARNGAGERGAQVALALLAPPSGPNERYEGARSRARLVTAAIAAAVLPAAPLRIAKYDDAFNPRAFGDLMQQWGQGTVLIESGWLPDDPQKQRLRGLTLAAILTGLESISGERYRQADPAVYDRLPYNTRVPFDLLVLGGRLVMPGAPAFEADLGFAFDDPVQKRGLRLRDVGDLTIFTAFDTVDAGGLFLHPRSPMLDTLGGGPRLVLGGGAALTLRRGADPGSEVVRRVGGP